MSTTFFADIGVPMIFVNGAMMIVALIPIIIIEAFVTSRLLQASIRKTFSPSAWANLVSTFVGLPISWLLVTLLDAALESLSGDHRWPPQGNVLERVWILLLNVGWQPGYGPAWLGPAAAAILLVPCFFASVLIEYFVWRPGWKTVEAKQLRHAVFKANLASYALLLVMAVAWSLLLLRSPSK